MSNGEFPDCGCHYTIDDDGIHFCPMHKAARQLLQALENLLLEVYAPESGCSCHINPPCLDCVNYSSLREFIKDAKEVISKAREKV